MSEDFPEVNAELLDFKRWTPRVWGARQYKENILLLEARVLLKAVRRIVLSNFGGFARLIFLGDNLGVILAVERCRATKIPAFENHQTYQRLCLRSWKQAVFSVDHERDQFFRHPFPYL